MSKPCKESTLREDSVPKDELAFTEYFAAQLRRELPDVAVFIKGPLVLATHHGLANLHEIFDFCSRYPAVCSLVIPTYAQFLADDLRRQIAPATKEAVTILVETRKYIAGLPRGGPELQVRELVGELVMVPAVARPHTTLLLTEKDGQTLGLSIDEIFELGFANLRTRLRPLTEVAECPAGQIGVLCNDEFESCRLALLDSWSPLASAHGGKLIVAAPMTTRVLFIGEDTPHSISALRTLAIENRAWASFPLSTELFRWTPKRWEVVYPEDVN